jgi:arsenate reductase (thioredoxin)
MTDERIFNVLFLSQRSAARSVIAAALLNQIGRGKFSAFSAGVRPAAAYDPMALELLEHAKVPVPQGSPRHYRDFATDGASDLDFVFTLSDTAAGEPLPQWPGQPITAHWRSLDPERFSDPGERRRALIDTRAQLERRLRVFVNLPFASLDHLRMQQHVNEIAQGDHEQNRG